MDGPGPAAVKASVDEGMSSREPSSSAAGAPVQLSEFEIAVDLEVDELTECERLGSWCTLGRASWLAPHPRPTESVSGLDVKKESSTFHLVN